MRWVVLGVGLAGRARCKAILGHPECELAGVWRGRFAADVGAPVLASLDDAIAAADAVAICSPTRHHAEQARAALEAGRHVLVEFPVARGRSEAEALFALADAADRRLHVEHIELLTPTARHLRAHVRRDAIRSVCLAATRSGSRVGDDLVLGNLARFMRLLDACGPVASVEAVDHADGIVTARLRLASGAPVDVDLREGPDLGRHTVLEVDDGRAWVQRDDGLSVDGVPVDLQGGPGLFAEDQAAAMDHLLGRAAAPVARDAILRGLDLVEALDAPRSTTQPCHERMRRG